MKGTISMPRREGVGPSEVRALTCTPVRAMICTHAASLRLGPEDAVRSHP